MSVTNVVSQLRGLVDKANSLIPKLAKIYLSEQQWEDLGVLSEQLAMTANTMKKDIRESKESREERAWRDSEDLRSHALACKGDLLTMADSSYLLFSGGTLSRFLKALRAPSLILRN
jgi:hypothetical protein